LFARAINLASSGGDRVKYKNLVILATLVLIFIGSSWAQGGILPMRIEVAPVYHVNFESIGGEYAFALGSGSSLGLHVGAGYGIRDAYNCLSLGARYYPFSPEAVGPFLNIVGEYGFNEPSIQGNSGTLIRPSISLGYRAIAFRLLTGSIAAGAAYNIEQNLPEGIPEGLDLALTLTLGLAF
jgi:hypothetical protein